MMNGQVTVMRISTFFYTFIQGAKNIWKNKMFSLASIATMSACIFLFGIFYCLINALQAMGAAAASFLINISRQGLIYIPALFLLRQLMGANGLVWAQPVADLLSLLLAAVLYGVSFTRLKQGNAGSLGMIPAADSI